MPSTFKYYWIGKAKVIFRNNAVCMRALNSHKMVIKKQQTKTSTPLYYYGLSN